MRVRFTEAGAGQLFAVVSLDGSQPPADLASRAYEAIASQLSERGLDIVQERVFGSLTVEGVVREARRRAFARAGLVDTGLLTFVEGAPAEGDAGLAGLIVRAAPRADTLFDRGVAVGRYWQHGERRHLVLQNVSGRAEPWDGAPAEVELARLFDRTEGLLASIGFGFEHVARTWFYVSNLLGEYAAFNRVRNAKYHSLGLMGKPGAAGVPASTAIGARNSAGSVALLDLTATCGPEGRAHQLVSNPKQPEAQTYGAAFSRGAIIPDPGGDTLELSGTAAIGDAGESLHPSDGEAQIMSTFHRIQSLLATRSATLHDIAAAVAFVKRPADVAVFRHVLRALHIQELPCVVTMADVCREELLFELDAELVLKPDEVAS